MPHRTDEIDAEKSAMFEALTRKQKQALEAAYHAGFFERPQRATATDVAETLDISRSTFLYHLRAAELEVFEQAFDDESSTQQATDGGETDSTSVSSPAPVRDSGQRE